jgi:hypothetical protein
MSRKPLAVAALLLALAPVACASDPTGIYAVIDKVILQPSVGSPEPIQVWGTFALAKGRASDDYAPPTRGYLTFSIIKGKEDVCRKEWADLDKLAGTKQCVAFGARYTLKGTARQGGDPTKNPVPYSLGFGLTKVLASDQMAKKLLDASKPPAKRKDKNEQADSITQVTLRIGGVHSDEDGVAIAQALSQIPNIKVATRPTAQNPTVIVGPLTGAKYDLGELAQAVAGTKTPSRVKGAPSTALLLTYKERDREATENLETICAKLKGVDAKKCRLDTQKKEVHIKLDDKGGAKLADIKTAVPSFDTEYYPKR